MTSAAGGPSDSCMRQRWAADAKEARRRRDAARNWRGFPRRGVDVSTYFSGVPCARPCMRLLGGFRPGHLHRMLSGLLSRRKTVARRIGPLHRASVRAHPFRNSSLFHCLPVAHRPCTVHSRLPALLVGYSPSTGVQLGGPTTSLFHCLQVATFTAPYSPFPTWCRHEIARASSRTAAAASFFWRTNLPRRARANETNPFGSRRYLIP